MNILDQFLDIFDNYQNNCQNLIKQAKIRKLPSGKCRVLSEKNKNLGTFSSRKKAEKRLKQVEYFKYLSEKDNNNLHQEKEIDLSKLEEKSLSALMRLLNKQATKEQVKKFLELYKNYFDKAIKEKSKQPDVVAFDQAFVEFSEMFPVKLNKKLVKDASF